MLIETAETIDIFVDSVRAYSLTRDLSGAISLRDHGSEDGALVFADREALETFIHALNRIQRY